MTIGEKIYTLRTKSGMTQEQLAEKMGVSRQAISKWESDVSIPELNKLKSLANLFQVTLDELMGQEAKEEKTEKVSKAKDSVKVLTFAQIGQAIAIILLGIATIIQAVMIAELKGNISHLMSENARLSSMISYTPTESEEYMFEEFDFELGEINEESKSIMFSVTCIPKEYSETTKIMLTLEARGGEVYNMELQGENGIFKGEKEVPICAIDRALFIVEDEGVKNVEIQYGLFDAIQEVYPGFQVKVPSKNEIKELELSLTGNEGQVLEDHERKIENVTLQLYGGWTNKPFELLGEKKLTKEEVEQLVNQQVVKIPVEMKGEEEPEYVYIKVLFEHALLEGEQVLESESVPMDQYRVASFAVLNLYYEYTTTNWQR